jgi:hypothetical protein
MATGIALRMTSQIATKPHNLITSVLDGLPDLSFWFINTDNGLGQISKYGNSGLTCNNILT